MRNFFVSLLLCLPALCLRAAAGRDTIPDTPMSDTLKTVVVTDDGRLPIHVSDATREHIGVKTMGDVLGESVLDKMMHPFAIKQRKRERHNRKMRRILMEYDMVKTDRDLLIEALRREGIDPDSLISRHKEALEKEK
ncbi:MAG: hypothetical protein LUC44_06465 [Prevotellaceae bacterium]|nr:hypothetical protein [Prevotellaceae bacterium]